MKISTGTIPGNFKVDLGLQKSFIQNKLSLTFKINDVFDTGRFIVDTENSIFNSEREQFYTQLMYAERQRQKGLALLF